MNIYEKIYEKKHLNRVIHTTLNPDKPGAVRIHLVPGKFSLFKSNPSIVILDGKDILPLTFLEVYNNNIKFMITKKGKRVPRSLGTLFIVHNNIFENNCHDVSFLNFSGMI